MKKMEQTKIVQVRDIKIGGNNPLVFIIGICAIESKTMALNHAKKIKKIVDKYKVPWIFKASYDKANRTKLKSFRGCERHLSFEALKIIHNLNIPILVDFSNTEDMFVLNDKFYDYPNMTATITKHIWASVVQVPALLCRQTNLLKEGGFTKLPINIKKGQFLAPEDMKYIIEKIESTGNKQILLTERGTCFGHGDLINDMRSILIMKKTGYPVLYDATHSQQGRTGKWEYIIPMAKAAVALGVDGLYLEVHENPSKAKCDKDCVLPLNKLDEFIKECLKIRR